MTEPVPVPSASARVKAERLPAALHWEAARRLVSQQVPDRGAAATRLVTGAATHGIDLALTWGVTGPGGPEPVRQVCLAVMGSGKTVMLFISEPPPGGDPGGPAVARAERAACIRTACEELPRLRPVQARIAQALPEPRDGWAIDALRDAGFIHVGDLSYMRRVGPAIVETQPVVWPAGVRVVRSDEVAGDADAVMVAALDRSYVDTLDCPELCGLRETGDILLSHRATGRWDPALWWVVYLDGSPEGCLLLNRAADRAGAELVYLGLSPALRGQGLGARLLTYGLARLGRAGGEVNCAVDERNEPAIRLYRRMGFAPFARRVALVRRLGASG